MGTSRCENMGVRIVENPLGFRLFAFQGADGRYRIGGIGNGEHEGETIADSLALQRGRHAEESESTYRTRRLARARDPLRLDRVTRAAAESRIVSEALGRSHRRVADVG
jgi:hypothetical protein